jgi:hypothetical protein
VTTVCLAPTDVLYYLHGGGGHLWVYLNWALGLRALGCRVLWLEWVEGGPGGAAMAPAVEELRSRLAAHGVALAIGTVDGTRLPPPLAGACLDLDAACSADLLLNFRYALDGRVVRRFRRSALVDIDPGLLQLWMAEGVLTVAPHDVCFTTGETVGQPGSVVPGAGRRWHHTLPPVSLDAWTPARAESGAPYTTVSNWWGDWVTWGPDMFLNDKRTSFLEYAELPGRVRVPLELALTLAPGDDADRRYLEVRGWRVRPAWEVSATEAHYQAYIRGSRGEFSCAKPSCMRLANAWISDRTLCYLASGKPAVVQHTGPSRFLPDAAGLLRFRDLEEAARRLEAAETDYDEHCRAARALVEEHFDARRIATRVLEVALG